MITDSGRTAERSRRRNALTLPVEVLPATQSRRVSSSSSSSSISPTSWEKLRSCPPRPGSTPVICTAPSLPTRWWSRLSRAATCPISIVYWLRSSSPSANTNGISSCSQNSARVQ